MEFSHVLKCEGFVSFFLRSDFPSLISGIGKAWVVEYSWGCRLELRRLVSRGGDRGSRTYDRLANVFFEGDAGGHLIQRVKFLRLQNRSE